MQKSLVKLILLFAINFIVPSGHAQCTITHQPFTLNIAANGSVINFVQSFTVPCDGNMEYFELTSGQIGTQAAGTFMVYQGSPSTGVPIYSQSYPAMQISAPGNPIIFDVTSALLLYSGNQYSFRFSTSMNFYFTNQDLYPGGVMWQNGVAQPYKDCCFEIGLGPQCWPTAIIAEVATLLDVTGECSVTMTDPPTATNNCGAIIYGVPNVTFPITSQGTTPIIWTYDDGSGNITTQTQNVIIADVSAPYPNLVPLPDLINQCEATTITPPTATDICNGTIIGTTSTTFPILTLGNSVISWTFDDGNGNVLVQTQNVVNSTIDNTVTANGSTIQANQTMADYQWLDCDAEYAPIDGEINQFFATTVTGNYAVEITVQGCSDTSACQLIDFTGIEELTNGNKELVKIIDLLGRETEFKPNMPLIFIYSDGTMERVMEVEL